MEIAIGGLVIWKVASLAAAGAVGWNLALSREIPTGNG